MHDKYVCTYAYRCIIHTYMYIHSSFPLLSEAAILYIYTHMYTIIHVHCTYVSLRGEKRDGGAYRQHFRFIAEIH